MLSNIRLIRRRKISTMYSRFNVNYRDILHLYDNSDIDYEFFISRYTESLKEAKELNQVVAIHIHKTIDDKLTKMEEKSQRTFAFEDTDTEDESSEAGDENGTSDRSMMKKPEQERFANRIERRLQLLLITESRLLLDSHYKRKKFIRQLLKDSRYEPSHVINMFRLNSPAVA